MNIKNFSVGPSALFPGIADDIKSIAESGILEKSHRSPDFSEMSKNTILSLKKFLKIPKNYYVFYTSSASEAMEMAVRHAIEKKASHITQGAFGQKWYKMSKELGFDVELLEKEFGDRHKISEINITNDSEALFITANETSTGAMFASEELADLRKKFSDQLLCVDATSCAGAVDYDLNNTDCFVFSVQKCFGIPSGLGIFICSPRFFEKAKQKQEQGGDIGTFHSLPAMWKKMNEKYQTSETPPVMQIALLGKVLERIKKNIGNLATCAEKNKEKAQKIWNYFDNHPCFEPFVQNYDFRSNTVVVVKGDEDKIAQAKNQCAEAGIFLAGGYGKTKPYTFRIANFLAHTSEDHEQIFKILDQIS